MEIGIFFHEAVPHDLLLNVLGKTGSEDKSLFAKVDMINAVIITATNVVEIQMASNVG